MKTGFIGMGFVGGTTAKVFGEVHEVLPYDRFKAPYNTKEHMTRIAREAEVAFICVPTPMKPSGEIDYGPMHHSLSLLQQETMAVGRDPEDLLVTVRSTAVSGTTDAFANQYPFPIAFNPEFLREAHAYEDMKNTNRVVVGVEDAESERKLRAVYEPLFPNAKFIVHDRKTAEMVKYAANAILATQVMIGNDLEKICRRLGIDYNEMITTVQEDDRIGRNMAVPGPDGERGFGGKCFPKDICALIYLARENKVEPHLLAEAWRSNLEVRDVQDWHDIPGAVSENTDFRKN